MATNSSVSDEQILAAIINCNGNKTRAALEVGMDVTNLRRRFKKMITQGHINEDDYVPGNSPGVGRKITRVSTRLDAEGNPTGYNIQEKPSEGYHEPLLDAPIVRQSTYTAADGDIGAQWNIRVPRKTQEAELALVDGFSATLTPIPPQAQLDHTLDANLMNQYTFSDVHVGLMCDEEYITDLPYTESLIAGSFELMVERAPLAKTAVINILGDWFHFDGLLPVTPRSQHVLFSSGHFHQMVASGVKIMRKLITAALFKHERVVVVISEGNHDQASALWLRTMFKALYEKEARVRFIDSDDPFYAFRFGTSFLGYHHGHIKGIKNPEPLVLLFADQFHEDWGKTTNRYIHTGHLHHIEEKEVTGAVVTQHATLMGMDNNSRRKGYRSKRGAVCTTYSSKYGQVCTNNITPDMLQR